MTNPYRPSARKLPLDPKHRLVSTLYACGVRVRAWTCARVCVKIQIHLARGQNKLVYVAWPYASPSGGSVQLYYSERIPLPS